MLYMLVCVYLGIGVPPFLRMPSHSFLLVFLFKVQKIINPNTLQTYSCGTVRRVTICSFCRMFEYLQDILF